MTDSPKPRFFVGTLAYNWETKDKKLYAYAEGIPWGELHDKGYRLYRFSADLPWHDLFPPEGHEMVIAPFEEDDTREPLATDETLAAYVFEKLRRVVDRLLPGRVYHPFGNGTRSSYDKESGTIRIETFYGSVTLTVR